MKISKGQQLSGTYTNGIDIWDFSGTVISIHTDTAGGNFATARIILDKQLNGRTALLATLDNRNHIEDNRFRLTS